MERDENWMVKPRRRVANSPLALKTAIAATHVLGRVSSRLAGPIASFLWFTPWRVPVSERGLAKQRGWLRGTAQVSIPTQVGRISAFSAGDGPVVLLVHGWGEQCAGMGAFIEPLVEAGYRVVGMDLPGHGRSGGSKTNIIHSGAAIAQVSAHFGGLEAVVAHSMGANAALYAMSRGLRPKRTVLLAPSLELDYAFKAFGQMFGMTPPVMVALKRKIERRFGHWIWRDLRGDLLAHNLPIPTLVFHDPEDPQVPFDGSVHLDKAWRWAELIEVPGVGHGPITREESVIERAVSFIRGEAAERPHEEIVLPETAGRR